MSNELMRKHLRAALDVAVGAEAQRVMALFESTDAVQQKRAEMLRPMLEALKALNEEAGRQEGLEISVPPTGHMASVSMKSSASFQRLSISTTPDNSMFQIEEYSSYSFSSDGPFERKHRFSDAESALAMIVDAIGKHIGSNRAVREWSKDT